jgi:hypothetical protein
MDVMRYTDPRMDDDDDFETGGIAWDGLTVNVFESFRESMLGKGIIVEAVPGGRWCGLELYYFDVLKFPGLDIPAGFKYQRPLLPSNRDDSELVLKKAIEAAEVEATDKESSKRWFGFIESLTSAQNDPKTKLAAIASGKAQTEPYKKRSMDGRFGTHIVVPPHCWFPDSVRKLDARQLLSIMPDVEASMFMLNLGRVVVGCSGNDITEGKVEHDYRYFAGLVGDASIGKSDLVNRIESALEKLGFKLSSWNSRKNNPFGWAVPLMSDWCTHKDVLNEETVDIVRHPILKAWSSGDTVLDNTKGGADVVIKKPVSGGFLFLANGLNIPALMMSDDAGVNDRFLPLACYELAELRDKYGIEPGYPDKGEKTALRGMTGFMWDSLSEQLGVSSDLLAAWLMRCSADMFLKLAGYESNPNGGALTKKHKSNIKGWVGEQRQLLRYNFSLNTKKDVVDSIKHSIAYFCAEQKRPEQYLELLDDVEFNYHLLSAVVAYTVEPQSNLVPEPLKRLRMQQLAPVTSGECFRSQARQIKVLAESKTPLDAFKYVAALLRTKGDGFGYPSNPVQYASLWRSALKEIPILVKEYESLNISEDNSALQSLRANMGSIFTSISKAKGL